jgi:hypothetical protein
MNCSDLASLSRRRFNLAGTSLLALPFLGACAGMGDPKPISVGGLFAGRIDDQGFMEAGMARPGARTSGIGDTNAPHSRRGSPQGAAGSRFDRTGSTPA